MDRSPDYIRSCYDRVAREYAEKFSGELANKPLDRNLLSRFAEEVRGRGVVYDFGCGPGQTTAWLHQCGTAAIGFDISPELIREARALHPQITFEIGDLLALPMADNSVAGAVAFYSIVHFSPEQLRLAIAQLHRVLQPKGRLLLAFHIGESVVHIDEFLGQAMSLDFVFFEPALIEAELESAGFKIEEVYSRPPYPNVEHPSQRAYITASKG